MEELEKIRDTRKLIREKKWCSRCIIIENNINLGLANSIIAGVTEVLNQHEKAIILEDDIVVSPHFLKYMNDGLTIYMNNLKVISIHAYNYPIDTNGLPETFFIKGADCWGWATWRNRWKLFEKDAEKLLIEIETKNLQIEFDLGNSYPYMQMLKNQVKKIIDSWAIRWYASAFLNNKYTLYPRESMVHNIGFDGSGTHKDLVIDKQAFDFKFMPDIIVNQYYEIETNLVALDRWKKYFFKIKNEKDKSNFPNLKKRVTDNYITRLKIKILSKKNGNG